ncbi:MAG: TIGR02300 family protein [Chakrabartia sp.]
MAKPEWGTKRSCPKCATRFYDLGKEDPVTCISCGQVWVPEPFLKSKQPMPFGEAAKTADPTKEADSDLGDDLDIDVEDTEPSPDDEVDLGGDDDLGVDTGEVIQDT